ncbi:MAG: DUF4347 domain-containing protein [Pseudobdellovibrio sp.]
MKSKSILCFLLFLSSVSWANICSEQRCPNGKQSTSICFNHPDVGTESSFKAASAAACGYFTEIVTTKNIELIKSTLSRLARSCKSLDRLTLFGHGDDGYLQTGNLNSSSIRELSDYSCLFNKDAKVQFYGCNVGRGCSGDMLMYQAAKSLLGNGGTVTAPTFYASSFLAGIIPHFSLNGKSRKLFYTPSKNPPDSWTLTGLAISNGGTMNDRCSSELGDLMSNLDSVQKKAQQRGCSLIYNYVNNDRLRSYRTLQTRLSTRPQDLQSAADSWYDLGSAVYNLKFQIRQYESCEPPVRGSESSSTKTVR